jgi:hypothetical protein
MFRDARGVVWQSAFLKCVGYAPRQAPVVMRWALK